MSEWMSETHLVLDYGFVRLDSHNANDLSVVNSARVSFGKRSTEISEADIGLINFLIRERHGTPFEHNSFVFHVKAPIFVAREWFRHRIGSFNEYSGRYSEMPQEYYVPEWEDLRTQTGKPGSYTFEPITDAAKCSFIESLMTEAYVQSFVTYRRLLDEGLAKELARSVIPVGAYTEFYWTVNARSLMNFISLRGHDTAQLEIRRYAEAIEEFFALKMPITYAAFKENNRVAP